VCNERFARKVGEDVEVHTSSPAAEFCDNSKDIGTFYPIVDIKAIANRQPTKTING
jgi:hypothetical protein